jgi:hypothetical protein
MRGFSKVASTRLPGSCPFRHLIKVYKYLGQHAASELGPEYLHSPPERHGVYELLLISLWRAAHKQQQLASTKGLWPQSSRTLQAEFSNLSYNVFRSSQSPPKQALQSDSVWSLAIFKTTCRPCLPREPMHMSLKEGYGGAASFASRAIKQMQSKERGKSISRLYWSVLTPAESSS